MSFTADEDEEGGGGHQSTGGGGAPPLTPEEKARRKAEAAAVRIGGGTDPGRCRSGAVQIRECMASVLPAGMGVSVLTPLLNTDALQVRASVSTQCMQFHRSTRLLSDRCVDLVWSHER